MLNILLQQRQQVSLEIAKYKKANNLNVLDGKQEKTVIQRNTKQGVELGIGKEFAEELAKLVIKYSKIIQTEQIFKRDASHLKQKCVNTGPWHSIKETVNNFFFGPQAERLW